jgi:transcriptional regulator with XRE-family HTH domain
MINTLEPNVGQRIRATRERQGLSLRALAEQCGLSLNAISLIERGENSPTVSSLHLLATALGVPITHFFEDAQEQAVIFLRPDNRLRSEANGITLESLGYGLRNQQTEPFFLTIAPGAGNLDQPISHSGEEFVYCLEGEVVYCVGEQTYHLKPGCTLFFQATLAHCFSNETESVVHLIISFHAHGGNHVARRLHMTPLL